MGNSFRSQNPSRPLRQWEQCCVHFKRRANFTPHSPEVDQRGHLCFLASLAQDVSEMSSMQIARDDSEHLRCQRFFPSSTTAKITAIAALSSEKQTLFLSGFNIIRRRFTKLFSPDPASHTSAEQSQFEPKINRFCCALIKIKGSKGCRNNVLALIYTGA